MKDVFNLLTSSVLASILGPDEESGPNCLKYYLNDKASFRKFTPVAIFKKIYFLLKEHPKAKIINVSNNKIISLEEAKNKLLSIDKLNTLYWEIIEDDEQLSLYNNVINSSYSDFNIQDISFFVKNLANKNYTECDNGFELYDSINDYLSDLYINIQPTDYFTGSWSNNYVSEAITLNNGGIIIYSISPEELYDLWESKYERLDIVRDWTNTIVHELTHRYQLSKSQNRKSTGYGESEYDYLMNKDEIAAHVFAGVVELLNIGYSEEQIEDKISNFDDFCDIITESNQLYPYLSYIEDKNDSLYKVITKQMYSVLDNFS